MGLVHSTKALHCPYLLGTAQMDHNHNGTGQFSAFFHGLPISPKVENINAMAYGPLHK